MGLNGSDAENWSIEFALDFTLTPNARHGSQFIFKTMSNWNRVEWLHRANVTSELLLFWYCGNSIRSDISGVYLRDLHGQLYVFLHNHRVGT